MGLFQKDNFDVDATVKGKHLYPVGGADRCFYCKKHFKSKEYGLVWMGTEVIFLHAGCASDLIIRLSSDLHNYEIVTSQHAGFATGVDQGES